MAQTYFRFKQFKIEQDRCAMKVCTDACLFGSIVAGCFGNRNNVLDIGSGTGLLSLMYAQKNEKAKTDAVEIDEEAFLQSTENIQESRAGKNINLYNESIQTFSKNRKAAYDLIISNPPFFENHLKSNDERRNKALHSSELSLQELIEISEYLLTPNGLFAVLLPYERKEYCISLATEKGLFTNNEYLIKQTEKHDFFRVVLVLGRESVPMESECIVIRENADYSLRFKELLKDYYLYL